ncbi:hypothetical protein M885DRAFT_551455 [Pelagophyceae sp. CCMP2097]|nr:hypothetical protein M885DRAFT_551455 [Pelagophyceae sp. CCMP2097]
MFGVQKELRFSSREEEEHNVGPGTYNNESYKAITKASPRHSGFGGGARGDFTSNTNGGAAPGAYDIPGSIIVDRRKISAPFRSTTQRAALARGDSTPGPGTYEFSPAPRRRQSQSLVHDSIHGLQQLSADDGSVRWERVPTAPSIPARKQCYGYDEGSSGELVPQRQALLGYDGFGHSAVGPADYRPQMRHVKPATRTVDFARQCGHAPLFEEPATPQPFANVYHSDPAPQRQPRQEPGVLAKGSVGFDLSGGAPTRDGAPRESSCFTAVKRPDANVADAPGPGSYEITRPPEHAASAVQRSFGSHARRFDADVQTTSGPGPGSYDVVKVDSRDLAWARRALRRSKFLGPNRARSDGGIGFDSTSTRFDPEAAKAAALVGPGSYEQPGLAQIARQRLTSRTGAFGTSTSRFLKKTEAALPGPGDYSSTASPRIDASKSGRPFQGPALFARRTARPLHKENLSSSFASETGRTRERDSAGPPPGAYEVQESWHAAKGVAKLSSGPQLRFAQELGTTSDNVGPGTYSLASGRDRRPRKCAMAAASTRFGGAGFGVDKQSLDRPGPGSYDYEMPHGNLLKPTYNVAIAAQCRELTF